MVEQSAVEQLKNKLKTAVNFPSPPAIAQQIIALASDPDVDVVKIATAVSRDPGLTAKVLRVANSPLYSKRRKSENLRQAIVVLGMNATITLALSFSLVATYKTGKGARIDYGRYWRRAILSASAARTFGMLQNVRSIDDLFLAALLQDIAILAIDRLQPDFYSALPLSANHAQFIAHEVQTLGADHAELGAWLLEFWKLPESLSEIVKLSHSPAGSDINTPIGIAARCVALGSECVEVLLAADGAADIKCLSERASEWLGINSQTLSDAMSGIVGEIPEIERLYDTSIMDPESANAVLEQARDLLMIRNLQALGEVTALKETSASLEAHAVDMEEKQRRDSLTGVFNRRHLDEVLDREYRSAVAGDWPLSVVFADLDRFKLVNDTYGHPAGDAVLVATAKLILDVVRDSDCVARYGGEEFVIVLPGVAAETAAKICERLLDRLRRARHEFKEASIVATASLGLATHSSRTPFQSVAQLIEAADRSVYAAKKAGRDRLVCFDSGALARTA